MTAERPLLGGLLYGVNTQGGLNPCFDEAMETIMTCHYSGVLMKIGRASCRERV